MVLDAPKHYPVLLNELISIISPQHGGTFIDCTFGQGGYTQKILSYKNTNVIALDRDIESKIIADRILDNFKDRFIFKNKRFSQLSDLKLKNENIKGVVFDLGYSFTQIKDPKKGLSFNSTGELNMQMGLNNFSAKDVINKLNGDRLKTIPTEETTLKNKFINSLGASKNSLFKSFCILSLKFTKISFLFFPLTAIINGKPNLVLYSTFNFLNSSNSSSEHSFKLAEVCSNLDSSVNFFSIANSG